MANTCSPNNKLLAQTLFLGASVTSFNCNLGWSGQPSQLTVNLAEDLPVGMMSDGNYGYPCNFNRQYPIPSISADNDNYYYTCNGDSCYVDRDGSAWSSGLIGTARTDGTIINAEDVMLPGKLYYYFNSSASSIDPFVSKYYYYPDPGFLGNPNRFNDDGSISYTTGTVNSGYDIIGTPVYFKMENFTFGGIVQSWEENLGQGGKQYRVTIEGMQGILSSCYIIVGEYAGSIFSKYGTATVGGVDYGSPRNYIGNIPNHAGTIVEGNIPNVFNVYGFLESSAPSNFGGSDTNDEGMSAVDIIYGLRILTSCMNTNARLKDRADTNSRFGPKTAYSPYGRILVKTAQKYYSYDKIPESFNSFGVIPPQTNLEDGNSYCEFLLDLSDLPNPPKDFRIKGPVLSILDFLNQVTEAVGYDYSVELLPVTYNSRIYNVIKIKTISRLKQPTPNKISNTIKQLYSSGYNITSSTIGKEKNESPSRCVIIGGKQQRLLQAKSYRLAYTQTNLIFDARNRCFVDYISLGKINVGSGSISRTSSGSFHFSYGKIKFPSFLSTRNPLLNNYSNPNFSTIFSKEEELRVAADNVGFYTRDSVWPDNEIVASNNLDAGNYVSTIKSNHPAVPNWGISSSIPDVSGITIASSTSTYNHGSMKQQRYFPLYRDIICPFFGYLMDNEYDIDTTKSTSTSDFRRPRPVFFDTWTGQICVLFRASELPKTRIDLEGLYGGFSGFNRVANPYSGNGLGSPTIVSGTPPGTPPATTPGTSPGGTTPGTPPGGASSATSPGATTTTTTQYSYPTNNSNSSRSEHFFIITESEMRAALAGADEFLIYNTAKTYKTDMYMMMNEAYVKDLTSTYGGDIDRAKSECNWHWRLQEVSVGGMMLTPITQAPDKSAGAEYISEDVRKDFELLQKFVKGVAEKYYGKKYMVQVPYLSSREDRSFADIALPTQAGYAYVFRGDNKFRFSYEPTNIGAWEEYGNVIDDCIAVGGRDWNVLSNEQGLILPIVGYNITDRFDSVNYNVCLNAISETEMIKKLNPAFSYNAWYDNAKATKGTCDPQNFIFPSIDIGALSDPTRYVIVKLKDNSALSTYSISSGNFPSFGSGILTDPIYEPNAFGTVSFPRKKLFYSTDVEEKFVFLNPETMQDPRIVIGAPSIPLNSSTQQFQKDPNSTVIATIAVEDAAVYMRSNAPSNWDYAFLNMLSSYVEKAGPDGYLYGSYAGLSKNSSPQNVMLRPKMMHPFFAGIPIKSNQYNYGPWTNYPYKDAVADAIFPDGQSVELDPTTFPLSATTGTITYTATEAQKAINNWILPTTVTVNPEFVPWNYGGMSFLDSAALSEAKSKVNYQSILETATIEMAGLPTFNLGGAFSAQSMNNRLPVSSINWENFVFTETKATTNPMDASVSISDFDSVNKLHEYTYTKGSLTYSPIRLNYISDMLDGPIISTIGVDISQNGVKTTYMFRTYTRKLSLFNKEYSDKIKKFTKENLHRQKEIAKIEQQISNKVNNENLTIMEQKGDRIHYGSLNSKLLATSPVEVIVASAGPYIPPPTRTPRYSEPENSQSMPVTASSASSSVSYSIDLSGSDLGHESMFVSGFDDATAHIPTLSDRGRIKTSASIYQRTELGDFLKDEYGSKSVMSLDGIFSPVSFYPTNNLSTFPFSKYHTSICPVCNGTGSRTIEFKKYISGAPTGEYTITCNACCRNNQKLNSSLDYTSKTTTNNGESIPPFIISSGTDILAMSTMQSKFNNLGKGAVGRDIPINLISLQPLIVPYGEFKNPNIQHYTGAHPEGYHPVLSLNSKTRNFIDRSRHSIGIVGRSSVYSSTDQNSIEIHKNIDNSKFLYAYPTGSSSTYHSDFFHKDLRAIYNLNVVSSGNKNPLDVHYEMNQRFIGLRGPIVMHAWGYDKQGYPVPNAADEPLDVDEFNRPRRFQIVRTLETETTWEKLAIGDVFVLPTATDANYEMIKAVNIDIQNLVGNTKSSTYIYKTSAVQKVVYKDDYNSDGGHDPATYKGSIIGKTQKFINNRWTEKIKLKEFYLNWGERPDTWPVGPIDLRWDESRKVWTANTQSQYKMMYITLEEDLIKHADLDDTYPARGFLDDVDFAAQPMPSGTRRVAFVKDRCGYTAPRGAKLLCRYDTDSGFYEPISKPSFIVKGNITVGTNQANIEMSYLQGKKKGENYPSMIVNFDNPFDLTTVGGKGLFTYINGKWTLTTSKSS